MMIKYDSYSKHILNIFLTALGHTYHLIRTRFLVLNVREDISKWCNARSSQEDGALLQINFTERKGKILQAVC